MPVLPYIEAKDLPEEYRALVARGTSTQRTIMHSLEGGRAYIAFGEWIRFKSRIDPRLREMVILQVAYVLKNEYELGHHLKISRDFGVTDADRRAILAETAGSDGGLAARDAVALRAARELVNERGLSDKTTADLLAHFDHECFIELVLIAGFYTFADLFLRSLRVELEDHYKPYLPEMPLHGA